MVAVGTAQVKRHRISTDVAVAKDYFWVNEGSFDLPLLLILESLENPEHPKEPKSKDQTMQLDAVSCESGTQSLVAYFILAYTVTTSIISTSTCFH